MGDGEILSRKGGAAGGWGGEKQGTLKAGLSSLNSSQGKAGEVDKAAERGKRVGEKR